MTCTCNILQICDTAQPRTNRQRWQIELLQLDEPLTTRTIQLQPCKDRTYPLTSCRARINLSPDLMLAVIDDVCYYLPNNIETAAPISLPVLQTRHSSLVSYANDINACDNSHLRTGFSACHRYISDTDSGALQPPRRPRLDLYYLKPAERQALRLEVLENYPLLASSWLDTAFHPTLPILAVVAMELVHPGEWPGYQEVFSCYIVVLQEWSSCCTKLEGNFTQKLGGEPPS